MAASQYQFLVKADGICNGSFWANKSGGNTDAESRKTYDGGKLQPTVSAGRAATDDITLVRPYVPEEHAAELRRLKKLCGRARTTLSIQSTDPDLIAVGEPENYPEALLIGVHPPESDAASDDDATWEIVFGVGQVA